jgi:hypothetical protein
MKNRSFNKFLTCMLLLAMLPFCLAGCQVESETKEADAAINCLTYRGQAVTVGGCDLDQLLQALGDDYTVKEGESCAGGREYIYQYPSLRLYATRFPSGNTVLTTVRYTDDGADHCGVRIGSPEADVSATFGEPDVREQDRLMYFSDGAALTFLLRDGVVTLISLTQSFPV